MNTETGTSFANTFLAVVDAPNSAGAWGPLIDEVGRILRLEPKVELLPCSENGEDRIERLLSRAVSFAGPVLVLPTQRTGHVGSSARGESRWPPRNLRRVLISSDASEVEASGARTFRRRLRHDTVHAATLHVMTDESRPRMWEGAGHHAEAWTRELRRRHGATSDTMTIVRGAPTREIPAHADSADLVVLLWRRDARAGHGTVVRSLLESNPEIPYLLVSPEWLEASSSAEAVQPEHPGPVRDERPTPTVDRGPGRSDGSTR